MRAWRAGGLEALKPSPRADTGTARAHPELFAEASALRLELPGRSAAQIASILFHRHGVAVSERTVRGQLRRAGLHREALAAEPKAYGRYEAARPNERWITDVLVGPWVPWPRREGSVRARLFLIVDDHSRLLADGRFFAHENARACQDLLRRAITRRGLPEVFYADNGAPFSNAWLARTCGVLGIRLVHSKPYSPEGRGKQERLNRYIREAFLAEAVHRGIESLAELNDLFAAWAGQVANRRVHAETGQSPIGRFEAGGPPRQASPDLLREAFRWSVTRRVTRTATVPLEGNAYAVDPALAGRRVELRYDPEDLTRIDVYLDGKPAGAATPFVTRRHVHRAVPQAAPPRRRPHRRRLPRPGRRHPRGGRRHRSQDRLHRPGQAHRRRTRPGGGRSGERGAVGGALRPDPHPVRQVDPGPGPVPPPGPRRGDRPDQLLRGGISAGSSHGGRRGGQDGRAARRRRRPWTPPGTRSFTSPTRRSAPGGLYVTIVRALGAPPRYLKAELMAQAGDLLAAETAERHRRVVLICDEAHLLQPDQLEELRLLTNSEMDSASPFAGILAGQPTLNRQLRMGMFAALDQRIATRFTIKPMDLAESAAYLRHHLTLAGRDDPLFADDATARLHRVANGLPRALNNAAAAALIAAAAAGKDLVDDACAKKAVAELTRD